MDGDARMMSWRTHALIALLAALGLMPAPAAAAPLYADIVVLMDESGSMAGEQAWIAAQIPNLEAGLLGVGLSPNQYGLIGFGASGASGPADLRGFDVGGTGQPNNASDVDPGTFGTAAQFSAAAANLTAWGGFEDGYAAIALANTLSGRSGAARNYILVSDEDRDVTASGTYAGLTYASTLSSLTSSNILLNAIVNNSFYCDNTPALGVATDANNNLVTYLADGAGGFTACTGTSTIGGGFGTTAADYVNLALATGGAAWDLNFLRSGGLLADSFTEAFLAIKVQEIQQQPVSEPATLALFGVGLAALARLRGRRR